LHQTRRNGKGHAQVRANVQMDVATWTPQVLTISGDDDQTEPAAFAKDLLEGVLYVFDRNFLDFSFLQPFGRLARGQCTLAASSGHSSKAATKRWRSSPAASGSGS
jgi:hypothetical protein